MPRTFDIDNQKRLLLSAALLIGLSLTTLISSCSSGREARDACFEISLLHTNDTHAHVVQFNEGGTACSADKAPQDACFGGAARRATKIRELRNRELPTLLLDAGDQFQGTLFHTYYKGQEAVKLMNLLGYDMMTLGNHEFDHGSGVLADFIHGVDFPVVCTNTDMSHERALVGLVNPWERHDVSGESIGVIGFITEEAAFISQPGPDVIFDRIEDAIPPVIEKLERVGINKIIGLSHSGYKRDQEVAAQVGGLDVIIGGHSHTFLSSTDPNAEGPYPTVVYSPRGEPVLIVTAGAYGKYMGQLDVTFDKDGVVKAWSGAPILLDQTIDEDPNVLNVVMGLQSPLEEFANKVIGETRVDLDGAWASCCFGECNLGDLITDIMLSQTASEEVQIALINGGGIRSSVRAGDITVGDVLTVLPFSNTLETMKIQGVHVRAALEHAVSRAENPLNDGTGRFLQVAGLRYTWDPHRPVGSRVLSVEKKQSDGFYAPLDDRALYTAVTTRFLRQGGDGYFVFLQHAIEPCDYGVVLSDAVIDYLSRFSPVEPRVEGRITRK